MHKLHKPNNSLQMLENLYFCKFKTFSDFFTNIRLDFQRPRPMLSYMLSKCPESELPPKMIDYLSLFTCAIGMAVLYY